MTCHHRQSDILDVVGNNIFTLLSSTMLHLNSKYFKGQEQKRFAPLLTYHL